jgi:hypothetical protein
MAAVTSEGAASRWLTRAGLFGLLLAGACTGTEHAVFLQLPTRSTVVSQPVHADAAPPSADAGRRDAGSHRVRQIEDDAGSGPDPGLDPNAVFAWKQSLPGQGTCKAGRYVGTFVCTIAGPDVANPPPMLSGAVTFTLVGSAEEQVLSITQGRVAGPLFFSPGMTGKLDCIAKHFGATSLNGTLLAQDPQNPTATMVLLGFNASLDGAFDDQALVIAGSYMMVNDQGQSCNGTFRASTTP